MNNVGSTFTDSVFLGMRQNISRKFDISAIYLYLCHTGDHTFHFTINCAFNSVESNECWVFVSNVPVKDRYGDQDEENSSDSSNSDSDESEVVQFSHFLVWNFLPTLYPDYHVQYSDEWIYRSWTQSWTEIFTERCHCWRRKIQRSIRKMPNSTQKRVWMIAS